MPDDSPRVFLSYGVHDASELAERLRLDLTARGYQVWQDVNRIRIGCPWDEEVQAGLRNSQVVLALLSPHSVRRTQMRAISPQPTASAWTRSLTPEVLAKSRSSPSRWFPARPRFWFTVAPD